MLSPFEYAVLLLHNMDHGGPLRFDGYEYLLQPLEDGEPRIVVQKAAQVGATVMAVIRALWFVDVAQKHAMYLFPTHVAALRFSRGRLRVLIDTNEYFQKRFQQVKRDNHLRAGSVNLYCHGGRSRAEVMSVPVQYLTIDERDEMYQGRLAGPQPWSAVDLARQRLSGQTHSWELNISTPTVPDHGVAAEFAVSDQQHYHPRCPHCDRYVRLSWPEAVCLIPEASRETASETASPGSGSWRAMFCCPACRKPWSRLERRWAIRRGIWIADFPGRSPRGYHLTQLLSPTQTAARLVRQWCEAQGNPSRLQVFHNSVLGLPYVAEGARLDVRFIEEAILRGGGLMAAEGHGTVMGVDVGSQCFHVVIAQVQESLLRIVWAGVVRDWDELAQLVVRFRVSCYVVDAMPETHGARGFLHRFPQGYMCWYTQAGRQVQVDHNGRTIQAPRTDSLDAMFLRWRLGKVLAPRDLPSEFSSHLTALVRVIRFNRFGEAVADYIASGADHYAHALNYCELAVHLQPPRLHFDFIPAQPDKPSWQT